ncbi:hypothetical protein CAL15_06505 [Bordetella genomosp. 13]|uniref:Transport permease protein n=2 Tax=Bordetella genomosp. 13 TaxID=463040 RepID=A0A1W6ZB47_9BORD|nr:hypothetical protein CAL15_06505 [Bordetella genomosp. 13]
MRTRFGQRRMGAFWMLAEPIVQLFVLTIVIGLFRGRGPVQGIPFPVFLLTGIAPFIMFRSVATLLMDGISANRGLFAYKQIMPMDTFVARTIMQCSISSLSYLFVMGLFAWYGFDMSVHAPLEWFGLLVVGIALSFGMGMLLAVIADALPEVRTFIRFFFLVLYFSSGAMFPVSRLHPYLLQYLLWNPFLHLTELLRDAVFPFYRMIDGISVSYVLACMGVLLISGLGLFRVRRLRMLAIKGIT